MSWSSIRENTFTDKMAERMDYFVKGRCHRTKSSIGPVEVKHRVGVTKYII